MGVGDGATVGGGVGDGVGVDMGTGVAVGSRVPTGSGVAVDAGVSVGSGDSVGAGIAVGDGATVGVRLLAGTGVAVGSRVSVGAGIAVGDGATAGVGVLAGTGAATGVGAVVAAGPAGTDMGAGGAATGSSPQAGRAMRAARQTNTRIVVRMAPGIPAWPVFIVGILGLRSRCVNEALRLDFGAFLSVCVGNTGLVWVGNLRGSDAAAADRNESCVRNHWISAFAGMTVWTGWLRSGGYTGLSLVTCRCTPGAAPPGVAEATRIWPASRCQV